MSLIDEIMGKLQNGDYESSGTYKTGFTVDNNKYFKLVYLYLKNNNYDSESYKEKVEKLKVKEIKDDDSKVEGQYYGRLDKLECKSLDDPSLVHEAFHIASYKNDNNGLSNKGKFKAFNEGVTDMFTCSVVEEYDPDYTIEMFVADTIGKVYGYEKYKYYFDANSDEFLNSFGEDKNLIGTIIIRLQEYFDKFYDIYSQFPRQLQDHTEMISLYDRMIDLFTNLSLIVPKEMTDEYNKELKEMLTEKSGNVQSIFDYYAEEGSMEALFDAVQKKSGVKE